MSVSTLYRKYRPQQFSDIIGQSHIVRTITNSLILGRVGHAYLLTGPRGTGKTTLARLFAKSINCSKRKKAEPCGKCPHCLLFDEGRSMDIIEIDAASHTGVDDIRELRETVKLVPALGSHKVYIIDEVHMLSAGAFNALLKTLEEPPEHAVFILATTELHKVPKTILSRCQRFDLGRLSLSSVIKKLEMIAAKEDISISHEALSLIADVSEGGMRDAESLLTQVANLSEGSIDETLVAELLGTAHTKSTLEFLTALVEGRLGDALHLADRLSEDGTNIPVFIGSLLQFTRRLLLLSADPGSRTAFDDMPSHHLDILASLATRLNPSRVAQILEHLQTAQKESKSAFLPVLPLEIALAKIIDSPTDTLNRQKPPASPPSTQSLSQGEGNHTYPVASSTSPSKSTETTPVSESAARTAISFDLSSLFSSWQSLIEQTKMINASLALSLSQTKPVSLDEHTVTLSTRFPFHKEKLDIPKNRLTLEEAFDRILGCRPDFRIEIEEKKLVSAENDSPNDPLVSEALTTLGGRLVSENT